MTAAASGALWDDGGACGACYEVRCMQRPWPWNKPYCTGKSVIVTVTNRCPEGSEGGWCDSPQKHLDMSFPAWRVIANNKIAGVVATQMRRVPCPPKPSGITVQITGNPFWFQVLVTGVAGTGDLSVVEISSNGGRSWTSMGHNWGALWSAGGSMFGKALSFRFTGRLIPQKAVCYNCAPANWRMGQAYRCGCNFRT